MTLHNTLCCALLVCCTTTILHAQTDKEKAKELGNKAVALEDAGKYDEALPLLLQAQKLDKANTGYQYEMAYCYREKKDLKKAASLMEEIIIAPDVREESFQMLGNIYDESGDSAKAIRTYTDGLKKFPNSGRMYLEIGNVYLVREQYDKAITFYEDGIKTAPSFPSNYYRAALLYANSTETMWAMIYGELFMNLERNTARTAEMSKILYETYKSQIIIHSKDSMEVNFSKNVITSMDEVSNKEAMPMSMIYEPLMLLSLVGSDEINTESLCRIRTNYIKYYYEQGHQKEHPSPLFAYQHRIAEAGHMDAYNHWILMKGDEGAFNGWQEKHPTEWESFTKWFTDNKIQIK